MKLENFKFVMRVDHKKSQSADDKSSLKVAWLASTTWPILEFCTPEISLERLKLETSNCVYELTVQSISLALTKCPLNGRGQDHVTHF